MIFQEPMTSLNPVLTIGYQIQEAIEVHENLSKIKLKQRVDELLNIVGIPTDRVNSYPDELSGGQRQRIMIAMAISCSPKLLIADEPTTALDVTVQAQILNLLNDLKIKFQMTMLFITHDFGVVSDIADDVAVMYQGEIVEQGTVSKVLENPKHPYTSALLDCVPDAQGKKIFKTNRLFPFKKGNGLITKWKFYLKQKNLSKEYIKTQGFFTRTQTSIKALDNVTVSIKKGITLAVVGESGSGKSTLAKSLIRLIEIDKGSITFKK